MKTTNKREPNIQVEYIGDESGLGNQNFGNQGGQGGQGGQSGRGSAGVQRNFGGVKGRAQGGNVEADYIGEDGDLSQDNARSQQGSIGSDQSDKD